MQKAPQEYVKYVRGSNNHQETQKQKKEVLPP